MGAAIFGRYSKHSDLLVASIQRTFAANSRSVKQTKQTFNKTFAVLKGPRDMTLYFVPLEKKVYYNSTLVNRNSGLV